MRWRAVVSLRRFSHRLSLLQKVAQSNYDSNYKSSEISRSTLHAGVDTIIVVSVAAITSSNNRFTRKINNLSGSPLTHYDDLVMAVL